MEDEGVWNCVIESDAAHDAPKILMKEGTVVQATEGEETSLICPTSIRPRNNKDRPTCIWFTPSGRKYDIIGR